MWAGLMEKLEYIKDSFLYGLGTYLKGILVLDQT